MKLKYIEKDGRNLIIEFFSDGTIKAVHEWTGGTSAAYAVRLDGDRHREVIEWLCDRYTARFYHNELARLRRAERRGMQFVKYITVQR